MKSKFKQTTAWLLTLAMIFTMLPSFTFTAFAATGDVASVTTADNETSTYTDIGSAINAAMQNSGSTLTLLDAISMDSTVTIDSGSFTIDLGGKTWTFSSGNLEISGDADITITDSTDGSGKLSGTAYYTINLIDSATLEITGGTVENTASLLVVSMNDSGSTTDAELIVSGGKLITEALTAISASGNLVKVTGGTIESTHENISYAAGTIDLSEHDDPAGITIYNSTGAEVTPGENTIKLPEGYVMLDKNNNAVESLMSTETYTVGKDSGSIASVTTADGQTTTNHANINSAITAAKQNSGSTLTLLDAISTGTVTIDSGSFTIDLNGKTWYSSGDVLKIQGTDTNITITDSMNGGTLDAGDAYTFPMPASDVTVTAEFRAATTYPLWVGGEQFTSEKLTIEDGTGGTATFTPATGDAPATLTLTDYNYEGEGYNDAAIYYGGSEPLNLVLNGTNNVTHTGNASGGSFGVRAIGDITVSDGSQSGEGSLTATSGDADTSSYGVALINGNITVTGGSLRGEGGAATLESYGVYSYTNITVSDNGSLTGIGGTALMSDGVYVRDNIMVSGNGNLRGEAGEGNNNSCGVSANSITVSGGEVVAQGNKQAFNKQPTVTDTFDAAVWYGVSEEAANEAGPQEISELTQNFNKNYVKIAEAPDRYSITVSASQGGTVTADKSKAFAGATVTLTVTPDAGYKLDTLTVTGGDDEVTLTAFDGGCTFIMPAGNVTVSAEFEKEKEQLTVTQTNSEANWYPGMTMSVSNLEDFFTVTKEDGSAFTMFDVAVTDSQGTTVEKLENAGTYTVTLTMGAYYLNNYTLDKDTFTFTVKPLDLTSTRVGTFTALDPTYTGQTALPTATASGKLNFRVYIYNVFVDSEKMYSVDANDGLWEFAAIDSKNSVEAGDAWANVVSKSSNIIGTYEYKYTIKQAEMEAPTGLTAVNETIKGRNDGKITGLTTAMEYSTSKYGTYTPVTDADMLFKDGTYYVRTAAPNSNYKASDPVEITIAAGRKLTVTVPADQQNYTLSASKTELSWHGSTTITFAFNTGYGAGDDFAVMVNGEPVNLNSDGKVTLSDVEEDIVVTVAGVKINQYTITFDTDGGTAIDPIKQDYGTAITAPADPTKTGYTFAGWSPAIPATMPAEDIIVTAQWTVNQYTISFDTDDGNTIAPITQDYGTAITVPADPAKTGYTFAGWSPAIPATMPAGDITVTA